MAINHFSAGAMNYKYHGNILLTDNKHRKLFVIKQPKECKFMRKMHRNTFGGGLRPDPQGELTRSPSPPIRSGGLLVMLLTTFILIIIVKKT